MTISNLALLFLPIAVAYGENVADPPTAHSPVKLSAVSDPHTGRTAFSFQGRQEPPVIRATPGDSIDITLGNDMSAKPNSKCATGPCMNMTNLHFHGLHVSPHAPQDDVLSMMAVPGETLQYKVEIPRNQPPGWYWYHPHPHGESNKQVLDGMSGRTAAGMARHGKRAGRRLCGLDHGFHRSNHSRHVPLSLSSAEP